MRFNFRYKYKLHLNRVNIPMNKENPKEKILLTTVDAQEDEI